MTWYEKAHTDITRSHSPLLTAVKGELESAVDDNAVVNGHGAVKWRLNAGGEIDEPGHGTIGNMDAWLVPLCYFSADSLNVAEEAHLIVSSICNVRVIVQVHWSIGSRVNDVRDTDNGILVSITGKDFIFGWED